MKKLLAIAIITFGLAGCSVAPEQASTQHRMIYNEAYCQVPALGCTTAMCQVSPWRPITE